METQNILNIIDECIGSVEPVGMSHVDHRRMQNLEQLIAVHDHLTDMIFDVMKHRDSYLHSLSSAGAKAYAHLLCVNECFKEATEGES